MNTIETIRAEIERRYAEYRAKMKTDDFTYYEGMADALDLFEQFIDTLTEQPKHKPHTQSGIPPLDYYQGIMAGRSDVIDHPEQYGLQKTIKLDEKDMEMYQEVMTAIIFAKNRLKELGCEGLSERMTNAFEWLRTKFKSK